MNEAQKSAIQRHYKQLAEDLMMTEELLANLYQRKLFERNMIEIIRAERTPTEQIYKMLSMLTKRGPDAFDIFVDIIKNEYPWLAAMLETTAKSESETSSLTNQQNTSLITSPCACGNGYVLKSEQQVDGLLMKEIPIDQDIKTKVSTFIHKQFGLSKRISQQDKKAMEKWLSEQLQTKRKHTKAKKTSISAEEDVTDSANNMTPSLALKDLKRVFNKVRDENLSDILNSEQQDETSESGSVEIASDEIDGASEYDVEAMNKTVEHLESEVDRLINKMNKLEGLITQCHYILEDPDRKQQLPSLIKAAKYEKQQFERDLSKEKEKSEKMLNELYDYCKSINRLENVRQQQRSEIEKLSQEIEELKRDNIATLDKCKALEVANERHTEKEKTLQNLKKMVDDLKTSHNNLADENANFKALTYGQGKTNRKLGRSNFGGLRRGSTTMDSITGTGMARKTGTKPPLFSNRRTKPIGSRYQ